MSEQNLTNPEPVDGATQRQPLMQQLGESVAYMRECAATEYKRNTDKLNAAVLPFACLLLMLAISIPTSPQLKVLAFMAPMVAFTYYLLARVGIVRTMNSRQAYLTFHMLIATLLLGGTLALFSFYVLGWMFLALKVH